MNILLLHPVVVFTLISLPLAAVCLDPVPVQFEKTPVLVASGKDAIFTVQTVSDVSLIRWTDSGGTTLAMWVNGNPVVMPILQYQGRMSVTATQLKITNSQLRDSGNYSVSVEPSATTGLGVNTRSVQLKVFDAVNGVSLSLPALPLEGGNVSLSCSWSAGSEVSVVWGKGGVALSSDTRITISAGSLIIKSARRDDAGEYTCTVSNAVSAQTAKATLSVYYGPDAPQLTKTSSECVGGGDATVGQTVRLTCTSTSLPPASFSWELNGQPVTAGQSGSGVLNLQIFSTNQSGTYACTARNDITGGASKQQIDLAIVGTCLSGGAVAGIVVACVVALIIIIIVIIVLLRQRNVDRRLKDAIGLQKTNQNEGTTIANRALVNENHPDPTLHNSLPQNFTAIPKNNNGNIDTMPQNIPSSSNPLHHNGHLNTDVFNHNFSTLPDNGHQNNNSYPNNDPQRSFPQPVQHNPNILIQTGSSQPGALAHTVHVNLNTLPRTDQLNNAQPQTVHVNLNTFPPEANQPSQANRQHADQRESALHSQHTNANHQNLSQTGFLNLESLSLGNQTQTMLNNASTNRSRQPNSLIQTGRSHPTNQTNANRRTANSQSSAEERTRHSNPVRTNNRLNDTHTSTHLQQMPWDRLQGTPAYPNREVDSSDSSGSSELRHRSPQRNAQQGRSGRRSQEIEPAIQAPSASQRGDLQRPISPNMLNQSQMKPNVQRQVIQQSISTQPQTQTTVPQIQTSSGQNPIHIGPPLGTTTSQSHPQTQTATRPHQTVAQPSIPLTQAALQQHTAQTDNPFNNRIQHTQAALQNPGPPQPIQQLNKAGQRPPTPPPVLRPAEFQALPRERVQQARNIQPVKVQHRHRPPNMQRQTRVWHTSPERLPGMHPMHRHPMHMQQVHRGRPRR
ncbi:bromodomain-containing protein DDB_G0280777-like isoform X1 [Chanodichthys erythropterus]|uniref:bromodomain-containing protein DDB_G0280777-like isoform X1 n=1 Tax=Chanodichthys erythropterus TaxID=933992 RepID=UPI00351E714E